MFDDARQRLNCHIANYGYVETRDDYHRTLASADVAVSTALHEFFGVAMYVCLIRPPRRHVYDCHISPTCHVFAFHTSLIL